MTQVITTPDGVEHEFSDNASDAVIKKVLQSYSGQKTSKPDATGGAYTYDKGDGWAAALHNFAVKTNNITREAQDAYTYHGLDFLQGLLPGQNVKDLRAQTKASGEDVGPYAKAAIDAVARTANPLSRVGTGGVLSTAASGAAQEAAAAALHGDDPVAAGIGGGVAGGAIGTAGKYLATPTFLSNVVKHYGPMAATGALTHLGAGPIAGTMAGLASHGIWPSLQKVVPYANPWWNTGINAAVQGALSGRQEEMNKLSR